MMVSPSPFGSFHKNSSKIKNAPVPATGTRTENTISAVPPCLPEFPATSATVPTHRLPLTQALCQQILRVSPFPSALGGPFAAPLFAPLSASGTLCGCAAQFYFRLNGFLIVTLFNYTIVRLSRTFFREPWKVLPFGQIHGRIKQISVRAVPAGNDEPDRPAIDVTPLGAPGSFLLRKF